MKQVNSRKYNLKYYQSHLGILDCSKKLKLNDFGYVHSKLGDLVNLGSNDTVVDFGCGTGTFCFYLHLRYNCNVIGIDYSKDAIAIAKTNKINFSQHNRLDAKKITFFNRNNEEIPKLKNIKVVYLQDVIEHMYDGEIEIILDKFIKWNNKKIFIIIHTDNNFHLKHIRPLVDLLLMFFRKTSKQDIINRKKRDKKLHINLTTAMELKNKLSLNGFSTEKIEYSVWTLERLKNWLGKTAIIQPIIYIIYIFCKLFPFLRPSFFLLAKYER